jgi:hypothetical protein
VYSAQRSMMSAEPFRFGSISSAMPGARYCGGGVGVRDDCGAVDARDDGGTGMGLRAGVAGGCDGGHFAKVDSGT